MFTLCRALPVITVGATLTSSLPFVSLYARATLETVYELSFCRLAIFRCPVCGRNGSGHRSHPPPVRCKLQLACYVPPSGPAPHQRHRSASASSYPRWPFKRNYCVYGNDPEHDPSAVHNNLQLAQVYIISTRFRFFGGGGSNHHHVASSSSSSSQSSSPSSRRPALTLSRGAFCAEPRRRRCEVRPDAKPRQ